MTLVDGQRSGYLVAQPVQACMYSNAGACVVNSPAPERLATHKLVIFGERPVRDGTKSSKEILQAASPATYFLQMWQPEVFNQAWHESLAQGKGCAPAS